MKRTKINNLEDLDKYFSQIKDTKEYNLINYFWCEYGFYPIFFNELFIEFFRNITGPRIGICFEGQEIFYEKWVDELIILENFINTNKAYVNNKETDLLIHNFQSQGDRGVAFWYTIRNFNEDDYDKVINKYKFKNTLHPIGRDLPWRYNLFSLHSFKYATGENDYWTSENTAWKTSGTLGWNLDLWEKNYQFEDVLNLNQKYCTLFVKNTWKNRNFRSSNISEILVGDGTNGNPGFGFVDLNFYNNLVNKFISEKKYLIIINDLVKYPIPDSEFIIEFDMRNFFDVKKFLSVVHNSEIFISPSTSPIDLASYYCNTNLVLLDDKQNKNSFVSKICELKNKKSISYDFNNESFDKIDQFINQNF